MCARYAKKVQVSESGSVFNVGNRCKTYKYRTKKVTLQDVKIKKRLSYKKSEVTNLPK
jgi:hypothetical protein